MTLQQHEQFKKEFRSLLHARNWVKTCARQITTLERWNKGDSHKDAIAKAIVTLDKAKAEVKEKLKGRTYEEWRNFSKELSKCSSRLSQAVNTQTKEKWHKKMDELKFNLDGRE